MNIKTYQMYDIPDRDKYLLRPYRDKEQFINEFPKMMSAYESKHNLYFATFTFTNLKLSVPYSRYEEYFRYFRQKLDNSLLSNSYHYQKRPFFFLFPEAIPQTHFHGILFLHKQTSKNFQNKCILEIKNEYSEKLAEDVSSIRLKKKFINPYPKEINDQHAQAKIIRSKRFKDRSTYQKQILHIEKPMLKISDYRISLIASPEQQMKSFRYSVKNFISSRFTLDDIIVESKADTQKT
ncbi:MAG: hypothetical protein COA45_12560 [Zetaproteobacteria bacterium]|nr:MAG: hypothetical protein COA45_12560 [Zetaproteobacteria bacterium]